MLYLVATPIGNLSDITFRALEILASCDYILCEDTRHSAKLLNHYKITTPRKSFHKFNETSKENQIIEDLQSGKKVALISDAGTPGISDPGESLVKRCTQEQIQIISIPGPCAAIAAISCSGFPTNRFQFVGFLPKKLGELKQTLMEIFSYEGTTICYESPNRLQNVIAVIAELSPERPLVIARELTKIHEEVIRGTAQELLQQLQNTSIKGEIVLLIGYIESAKLPAWENLPADEHVKILEKEYNLTRQEAIKLAAKQRGVSKRDVYNKVIKAD